MTMKREKISVTYGIYSCSLEAFDDPFSEICKVTNMFRELAEKDRHFGIVADKPAADPGQIAGPLVEDTRLAYPGEVHHLPSKTLVTDNRGDEIDRSDLISISQRTCIAELRQAAKIAQSLGVDGEGGNIDPFNGPATAKETCGKSKYSALRTVLIP